MIVGNPITLGGAAPEVGTKTISENGTYHAADDNLDGFDTVIVNITGTRCPRGEPQGILQFSSLTSTYSWVSTAVEGII